MIRNTADSEADVARFVQQVSHTEIVWYLKSESGTAWCDSNEESSEGEPLAVLLFFSDKAYARRCQNAHYSDHEVCCMTLFDFLFRWLPGMSGDGVLAGPNWNQDLIGLEIDPFELRESIDSALSPEQLAAHQVQYLEFIQKDQ